MIHDRPVFGIFLMVLFCILAPLGDAMAKILGGAVPLVQLVVIRFAIQAIVLVPLAYATGRPMALARAVLRFAWLRVVLHIVGLAAMFSALQYLPLADAIAIAFIMPFLLLLAGYFWMNEQVGAQRLWACVVGFIGVTLVIQPSFQQVGYAALLPLVVAVAFSGFILTTRHISQHVDPIGLQAVNGVMAFVILVPAWAIAGRLTSLPVFDVVWPDALQWSEIAIWGMIGTAAHLVMTWSLRYAPSATLAPIQYLEIPIATVFGWLIFGDLPNGLAAIGIAVTIAAGLYIIHREHSMASQTQSQANTDQTARAAE